ncbi:MAG TPA: aldose 1-epimerase family protein [Streptosporangiaceae bacterium]|jgi:aldose 1-epimerase
MTISGNQYDIEAGPYRATITEQGGGLRTLTHDGIGLILSYDATEPAPAAFGQLLAPWPNRIDHGRYAYDGVSYRLDITEPELDTAIHGLVRWASWTVAERDRQRVVLGLRLLGHPGYPFRLDLTVEYALEAASGLTVRLSAENAGTGPAPYAHGTHPYLTMGRPVDECEVSLPGDRYLPADDRGIPTGPPEAVAGTPYDFRTRRGLGATRINNAYTGLARDAAGRTWTRLSAAGRTVALWADTAHPWLQVYTADDVPGERRRAGLAVEPMTCPPNAFVTGEDVIDLKPGHTATGSWGIMSE